MLKTKHILYIFLPALVVVGIALFVRIIQYQPLFPKIDPEQAKNPTALIIPIFPDDIIIGQKKAPITLVAFEDLGCESCKAEDDMLALLLAKYPEKLKIVWKGLPVAVFPYPTETAQKYAYCANKQKKFNEFKDYAYANLDNLSDATLDGIVDKVEINKTKLKECVAEDTTNQYLTRIKELANSLNIQSVPTFFLNNKQIPSPQSEEGWILLLGL